MIPNFPSRTGYLLLELVTGLLDERNGIISHTVLDTLDTRAFALQFNSFYAVVITHHSYYSIYVSEHTYRRSYH